MNDVAARIDVHNHAFPARVVELLERRGDLGVRVEGGRLVGGFMHGLAITRSFTCAAAKLEELEAVGLGGAVLSPVPSLFAYSAEAGGAEVLARETNLGLAELCAGSGGRLHWMATLPLQEQQLSLRVLDEAAAAGCVGIEIGASVADKQLDDRCFEELWSFIAAHRLVVMLHPATGAPNVALEQFHLRNVIGHPFETTVAVERLICSGVLERHDRLRLLLVHGGGAFPYQAGRLRHARAVRPELAAAPRDPWDYVGQVVFDSLTHDVDALAFLVGKAGVANVLVGTDLPFDMASRHAWSQLIEAVGTEAASRIAEENPRRVFQRLT